MAIIVNTNMSALKTQRNLTSATNSLNKSLERMSTGLKINKAGDDAAGLYVATGLNTQIRGSKVALNNVSTGTNVLQIMEGDLDVMMENLNRIRDLATQAANSVYSREAMDAMQQEALARIDEIDRIAVASNFNGMALLSDTVGSFTQSGSTDMIQNGLRLQIGANSEATANSVTLDLGDGINSDTLGKTFDNTGADKMTDDTGIRGNLTAAFASATAAAQYIKVVDRAITDISNKKSEIGAMMNRLDTAQTSLTTTIENNTAAKSTIMDADIAAESAEFTKSQILQQTSASLLVQANQLPSIALSLIQ